MMLSYQLLLLEIIVSSSAVAAYIGNFHHHELLNRPRTMPSPFISGQNSGRGLNQYYRQQRDSYSYTVRKSTSLDDDTTTSTSSDAPTLTARLTTADIQHMNLATKLARIGYGNTFPNPAVGCVLIRRQDDEDVVIGSGFHPKAGMPHAEVFALLEACGHVDDGVAAAKSVMGVASDDDDTDAAEASALLNQEVMDLLTTYKSQDGASTLFNGHFADSGVTAYVTLEPCCHVGQTPPCALSLVAAGINRVVVGYRDPNPRVDGGGIQLLENAGIDVHVLPEINFLNKETRAAATECSNLVKYFVKRILPREEPEESLEDAINGKKRRVLRSIAGRQKTENTIQQFGWPKDFSVTSKDKEESDFAENVPLNNRFLERIDQSLWDHEIVLLRLNNAVKKKKGAKILGGRIADVLNAHVAQVIGHTALLYRPTFPPVLDLEELANKEEGSS